MRLQYKHTMYACFIGYIVQAIVNNFAPLLFLTFQSQYGVSLNRSAMLTGLNFLVQLIVDLLAAAFADRIGYHMCVKWAHIFSAAGLIMLAFLPDLLPNAYVGIIISVVVYAIGGGLLEVLISPIVEACPGEEKSKAMSLLHSFYCWGHVGVVLLSALFFAVFGVANWKIIAVGWAFIPIANFIFFSKVPIASLLENEETGLGVRGLSRMRVFWILMMLMMCAGACEQAVSQWASAYAESALHVSKTVGDLFGPLLFAAAMGGARLFYGKFGERINLRKFMFISGALCLCSYLIIGLCGLPPLGFIGCALCGVSVGILWPGTFSLGSAAIPKGGTAMFALFALAGDLGCAVGPTFAGAMAEHFGDMLNKGILAAAVFPVLLLVGLAMKK